MQVLEVSAGAWSIQDGTCWQSSEYAINLTPLSGLVEGDLVAMNSSMKFQVVVLTGGGRQYKDLYPLVTKDVPKALLPVGNRPLLSYVLELLEANMMKDLIVVVPGDEAASQVENWILNAFDDRLRVIVESVPEDFETADSLRKISKRLTADDFLVVSGDLISDIALGTVAATHRRHGAALTALLCGRPSLSSSEASPGAPVKDKLKQPISDIICLDSSHQHLLFLASHGQAEKDIRIGRSLLRTAGQMEIRTDLIDAHLYAFNRALVLEVLESRPGIKSIKSDLVPYLIRSQLRFGTPSSISPVLSEDSLSKASKNRPYTVDDGSAMMERISLASASPFKCCACMASQGTYCARVNTLHAYLESNRAVANEIIHLTDYTVSVHNNVVHETAVVGTRTTVGPHCIVGEGSQMGDKCKIKRSVVGPHCRIGSNVNIMNSVVMNHVTIEDHCSIHNSVICSNALVQQGSTLKDCRIGAGYSVGGNAEHRDENLVKKERS